MGGAPVRSVVGLRMKRWAFKIAIGLLVLTAVAVHTTLTPTSSTQPDALQIGFAGFTNDGSGTRLGVFPVTNRSTRPLHYSILVEQMTNGGWPVYTGPVLGSGWYPASKGQNFVVLAQPPSSAPWRVSLLYGPDLNAYGRARLKLAEPFFRRGWVGVGELFWRGKRGQIVSGPEVPL